MKEMKSILTLECVGTVVSLGEAEVTFWLKGEDLTGFEASAEL